MLSLAENLTTHGWNIISQPSQTQSTTVGILLSELGLIPSSSEQRVCQSCVIEESSQAYSISSMDELTKIRPVPKGDVPADVAINAFWHKNGNSLDTNNVGRLRVLLAR